jgi:hypothetical protein
MLQNIDLDKALKLQQEREETMFDPAFRAWAQEFNISQSYEDKTSKINARELQMHYDTKKYSKLQFNY